MRNRSTVISLQRRREQKEMQGYLRLMRQIADVPDHLIEDVLGVDPRWDRGDYDDTRTADRLQKATGLKWPVPGSAERTLRAIKDGR